jgi:hypothetical protein
MKSTSPPKVERFPAAKQRRMDALLDKNNDGTITPRERRRLEQLVAEAEGLAIANAKRLAEFVRSQRIGNEERGVPVTVWVQADGNR